MESLFAVLVPDGVMSTPHQCKCQTQHKGGVIYPLPTASDMERLPGGEHRQSGTAVIVPAVFTRERSLNHTVNSLRRNSTCTRTAVLLY